MPTKTRQDKITHQAKTRQHETIQEQEQEQEQELELEQEQHQEQQQSR